jgi:hypothetical protein
MQRAEVFCWSCELKTWETKYWRPYSFVNTCHKIKLQTQHKSPYLVTSYYINLHLVSTVTKTLNKLRIMQKHVPLASRGGSCVKDLEHVVGKRSDYTSLQHFYSSDLKSINLRHLHITSKYIQFYPLKQILVIYWAKYPRGGITELNITTQSHSKSHSRIHTQPDGQQNLQNSKKPR